MLSVNSLLGATYSWSGPLGFASTQQNPAISNAQPNRSGIYTLTVNTPSCGQLTTTHSVVVGSSLGSLSASGNTPVCVGGTLNLTVTNRMGFTFNWIGPNGFTANTAQPSIVGVTTLNAGRYSVTVTSPGCGVSSLQTNFLIVNDPLSVSAGSNSPVCVGSAIMFTASTPTGTTWSWTGPASFASSAQNPSRSNAQLNHSGVYTLNATVPSCGVVSRTVTVVVNNCRQANGSSGGALTGTLDSLSVKGVEEDGQNVLVGGGNQSNGGTVSIVEPYGKLSAWPNPSDGNSVTLKWEGLSNFDRTITVRVIDASGKIVHLESVNYDLTGSAEKGLTFPAKLSQGVYTIETVHDNHYINTRMIVQ